MTVSVGFSVGNQLLVAVDCASGVCRENGEGVREGKSLVSTGVDSIIKS